MKALAFFVVVLLLALPALADGDEEEKDPREKFLIGVGKAIEKEDVSGVTDHFPEKGKIDLRLRGVRNGEYRDEQARSLLATWMKGIEPKKVKFKKLRGNVGKFELEYRDRSEGVLVKSKLLVTLEKEGDRWRITGITES